MFISNPSTLLFLTNVSFAVTSPILTTRQDAASRSLQLLQDCFPQSFHLNGSIFSAACFNDTRTGVTSFEPPYMSFLDLNTCIEVEDGQLQFGPGGGAFDSCFDFSLDNTLVLTSFCYKGQRNVMDIVNSSILLAGQEAGVVLLSNGDTGCRVPVTPP